MSTIRAVIFEGPNPQEIIDLKPGQGSHLAGIVANRGGEIVLTRKTSNHRRLDSFMDVIKPRSRGNLRLPLDGKSDFIFYDTPLGKRAVIFEKVD